MIEAERKLALRAMRLEKQGLKGKAMGEKLKVSTDEANQLAAVGRHIAAIDKARLTDNESLLLRTVAKVGLLHLDNKITRSPTSREVEWSARKYSGWCATTCQKRLFDRKFAPGGDERGLGLVDLAGNGCVNLTPSGWAVALALLDPTREAA